MAHKTLLLVAMNGKYGYSVFLIYFSFDHNGTNIQRKILVAHMHLKVDYHTLCSANNIQHNGVYWSLTRRITHTILRYHMAARQSSHFFPSVRSSIASYFSAAAFCRRHQWLCQCVKHLADWKVSIQSDGQDNRQHLNFARKFDGYAIMIRLSFNIFYFGRDKKNNTAQTQSGKNTFDKGEKNALLLIAVQTMYLRNG